MAKPSPLQVRNIVVAIAAVGAAIWNLSMGGPVWLTAMFGVGCVLAVASAVLNGRGDKA
ncbi:hypothetical protein [Amycolatopsis antarctica]|uniref:hypothetical protein n=1 Tax=Amycolatopsis antarctica TaxID=1854586 RepID=UPI0013FE34CE|nr:hypothetical protein [Amycolatopsis antarctica]